MVPVRMTKARELLHSAKHASRAYWLVQALSLLGMFAIGLMLTRAPTQGAIHSLPGAILRGLLGAVIFFSITHFAIRSVLRVYFMRPERRWYWWLLLAAWLLLLASVAFGLSRIANRIVPANARANVQQIQIQGADGRPTIQLRGPVLVVYAIVNIFGTYLVWTGLYLAWQAWMLRRRLQRKIQLTRLAQLTHQLNPHFLFNALNTIRGTIFEDQQRAAQLVSELSGLFRFHLSMSDQNEQTLAQDWQLAQHYLAIEKARWEDRLQVNVHIDPACLAQRLPSLALIGLLENAVKHGIANSSTGGDVNVSATSHADFWTLSVSNSVGDSNAETGTQVGLKNLRERLALAFGAAAKLEASELSASAQGKSDASHARRFQVLLRLPVVKPA